MLFRRFYLWFSKVKQIHGDGKEMQAQCAVTISCHQDIEVRIARYWKRIVHPHGFTEKSGGGFQA